MIKTNYETSYLRNAGGKKRCVCGEEEAKQKVGRRMDGSRDRPGEGRSGRGGGNGGEEGIAAVCGGTHAQ